MVLGTGKSKVCAEMIKRFVDLNYYEEEAHSEDKAPNEEEIHKGDDIYSEDVVSCEDEEQSDNEAYNDDKTSSRGPTVIYCAPSNKAVNVGACTYVCIYTI